MVCASRDHLSWNAEPGQRIVGNFAVVAHFAPDGGCGIDLLNLPARRLHLIEAGVSEACHKASLRPKHTANFLKGCGSVFDVHEGHVTDHQVKLAPREHLQAGCISGVIANPELLPLLARLNACNEWSVVINSGHKSPRARKTAGWIGLYPPK